MAAAVEDAGPAHVPMTGVAAVGYGFSSEPQIQPRPPLASLIEGLRRLNAVVLDPQRANTWFSLSTNAVLASWPQLAETLKQFGLEAGAWTHEVDLQGVIACLQKFKYQRHGELGSGSYGVVYVATDRETSEPLAVKKLVANDGFSSGLPASTLREIGILRDLSHENIVQLRDVISTLNSEHVYLVLNRLHCDLRNFLDTQNPESPPEARLAVKSIIRQVLAGVAYLHANSILHRDLKPQNVLLDLQLGLVKITDFGLARQFLPTAQAYTDKVVTPFYRAPELLLGAGKYTKAIDLWSVGCILAEMFNLRPLLQGSCEVELLMHMFQLLGTPTEDQWPGVTELLRQDFLNGQPPQWAARDLREAVPALAEDVQGLDLLRGLLTYDPEARTTAADALQHPWFL